MVATGRPAEPEQLTVDESDYGFEHGTTSITVDTERIEDEVQVYPVGGESSTAGGYFGRPNDTSKPRKPGPTVVGPGFGVALQLGSVPGMLTTEPVPSELPTASNCSNSERNSIKTPSREGDSPPTRRREPYCSSIRLRSAVQAEAYGAEPGMSVGGRTDTREELDEDCQEVTEFSGHATGSLLFEGCADRT